MYFNRDLYREAGVSSPADLIAEDDWTWESFREVSKQLTDATGYPGYVVNDFDFQNWTRLLPVMNAYGASPWNEDATRCTADRDRKSTRLNPSHVAISYAVFCL